MIKFKIILVSLLLCTLSGSHVSAKSRTQLPQAVLLQFTMSNPEHTFFIVTADEDFMLSSIRQQLSKQASNKSIGEQSSTQLNVDGKIHTSDKGKFRITCSGSLMSTQNASLSEDGQNEINEEAEHIMNFSFSTIITPGKKQLVVSHDSSTLTLELEIIE